VTRTQRQIEEHRQGEACLEVRDSPDRPCPGVPVWAEQETHAFRFGCFVPELGALPEPERQRYLARLEEVFNRLVPAGCPPEPGTLRVEVPDGVHLGKFWQHLDRLAAGGMPLEVRVRGRAVGLGVEADGPDADARDRAAAERVAELYTLCFAHPAVRGILWEGFRDGEAGVAGGGLLRGDCAPRRAFRYLHKLIGTVWHSRASGETDPDGRFRFRGFFGDYRVAARVGEEPAVAIFPHRCAGTPFRLLIPDER
jgi:hypothetical protein